MSLRYLKKEVRDGIDFSHKLQSFLQVDFNTLAIKGSYRVMLSFVVFKLKYLKSIFVKIELSVDSVSRSKKLLVHKIHILEQHYSYIYIFRSYQGESSS